MARVLVIERDKEMRSIIISYLKISLGIKRSDIAVAKGHWAAIHAMNDDANDFKVFIVGKISLEDFFGDEQNIIYVTEYHFPEAKMVFCTGKNMFGRGVNVPRPDKESIGQIIRNMADVKEILVEALV
jgi:hypothetical protein